MSDKVKNPKDFAKGLEGVIAAETKLSFVDGENSRLFFRGIPVGDLAQSSNFEETVFLLWEGRLPGKDELSRFQLQLASKRELPAEVLDQIALFPAKAHPMAFLRTFVSLLGALDPAADDSSPQSLRQKAERLTAVLPTLLAAFYRKREGKPPVAPDKNLPHAENFLQMMQGVRPQPEQTRALDAYLILLADHGLNASTFSARVTCATQSDIYSAVTSAIGTLKGDLHGSANQRAMEMILEIGSLDKAEEYVKDRLAGKKKIMGFGHRIYKEKDPRAEAFRGIAKDMCERSGERKWMDISNKIEATMWDLKKIPCNVDFFSASVLYLLGFPIDFFTTVFAASRVAGWTAHVTEQLSDNRLIRPAGHYTGPVDQNYIPVAQR